MVGDNTPLQNCKTIMGAISSESILYIIPVKQGKKQRILTQPARDFNSSSMNRAIPLRSTLIDQIND